MTTFNSLLSNLQTYDASLPLVFTTDGGDIGSGYHVTELRHSLTTGIDCGGNVDSWHEARLQLLDGQGATHMSVQKFNHILKESISVLPELAQAPVLAEYGQNNEALTLMSIGAPKEQGGSVVVRLGGLRAVCKPAQRTVPSEENASACCGGAAPSQPETSCCSTARPSNSPASCCA
ncbi:DUF6428 family protein [Yoonia sp. I 8.24]|uniref:DUF6428 family protein n=1 Tax=Yoonia sp. I 8.24 TaxID=1537229 RepID=UPI001EDEBA46|nr:DUF6428 family protein [Yoonia sp. I 8.24]